MNTDQRRGTITVKFLINIQITKIFLFDSCTTQEELAVIQKVTDSSMNNNLDVIVLYIYHSWSCALN